MKVILKKDVPNLGRAGDIKEVKDGYARNYLLPNDLVMSATAKSAKQQLFLEKMQERKIAKRKKTAQEMAQTLHKKEVYITVKTGEEGRLFGSVTNIHIQKALELENILVDKRIIQLDEPIKNLGRYDVVLRLYEGIQTTIQVFVQDEEGNIEVQLPPVEEEVATEQTEEESQTNEEEGQAIEEQQVVEDSPATEETVTTENASPQEEPATEQQQAKEE